MATTINETLTYPGATVAQVAALATDPDFRAAVASYQHALRSEVTVTPAGNGQHVRFEYAHGTDRVPSFAKKLVGDEIPIIQEESWTTPTHADLVVTIPGKPGDMKGTADIEQRGDDVVQVVKLTIKVSIPLLGGKIEDLIAGLLSKAMRAENKVGIKWLAGEWQS
ncbi:DUF2505 domain-containing protein [Nocardioides cavernaquae]|uniref:DUF2505 domain-containing protein n=1 Tax=Nocardioides cavernaquae TaxID=2321396 RepID=A0A3A5HIY2_9ACTN|nr:DUF2505 domain-containing protein [Nocardioides cavernaquae]RJS47727.1 DUF2505 domain-containing protein [Nocardioides cavernaquae]